MFCLLVDKPNLWSQFIFSPAKEVNDTNKNKALFLSDALLVKGQYIYLNLFLLAVVSTFLCRADTVSALIIGHWKRGVTAGRISEQSSTKK